MVQDVFLRLLRDDCRLLRSFDEARSSLPTWLTVVARSGALDSLRRRRLPTVGLDDPPIDPPAPAEAVPDERPELPRDLLSSRQRLILHLLIDENMTVAQVAETLGIDAQTVRSTRHKAIQKLREHFGEE